MEVFTETLNLKALRRSLINYYVANAMAILGGAYGLRYVANTMRRRELQYMLCLALEAYLPGLVEHMSKSIHVYSGSAIKHDGNYELASRVMATHPRLHTSCTLDKATMEGPHVACPFV